MEEHAISQEETLQKEMEEFLWLVEMKAKLPIKTKGFYEALARRYPEWVPYLAAADVRTLSPIYEIVEELEQRLQAKPGDDSETETLQQSLQRLIEGMSPSEVIKMLSQSNGALWKAVHDARQKLDPLLMHPDNDLGPIQEFNVIPCTDKRTTVEELMAQALAQAFNFDEYKTTCLLLRACADFVDRTFWPELFAPLMLAEYPEKIPVLRAMLMQHNMAEQLQSMSVLLWPQSSCAAAAEAAAADADEEDNAE